MIIILKLLQFRMLPQIFSFIEVLQYCNNYFMFKSSLYRIIIFIINFTTKYLKKIDFVKHVFFPVLIIISNDSFKDTNVCNFLSKIFFTLYKYFLSVYSKKIQEYVTLFVSISYYSQVYLIKTNYFKQIIYILI